MICLLSLRQGLRWPLRPACIQDAFFALLARWFTERGEWPAFYNVAWDEERPSKDAAALKAADWVFLFSSNEFTFHSSGVVNPLFVKSSNEGIERIKPALQGKRIVVFSSDAFDSKQLLFGVTLAGVDFAERHFISEADFPLTVQSVRYAQLLPWRLPGERALDFAYWGTTKARTPTAGFSGDQRLPTLREIFKTGRLSFVLYGNHFGPFKARKFNTSLGEIAPELSKARATACFQWPGHHKRITARYHEALALGLVPLVEWGYDRDQAVSLDWQRFESPAGLLALIEDLRGSYERRFREVERHYLARAPSDDEQFRRLADMLARIGVTAMDAKTDVMAEWQKGFPLARLKGFAEPFKQRHKPLVFGAFGLTKERDIADALASNRVMWTGGEPPKAVSINTQSARPSEQQDFAQRPFVIPAGTLVCKSFAALDIESGNKVIAALRKLGLPLVIEIFEEDEIAKQCVTSQGLRFEATKISAGSEIKGVYSHGLAAPFLAPLPKEDGATLAVLDAKFLSAKEVAAISAEIDGYGAEAFAQHYSDYNKRKSWTSFALRGYADDPGFIIKPGEMSKSWKEDNAALMAEQVRWTKAAKAFPATMRALEKLKSLSFDRVRFMRLRSKDGELSRHADITDRQAGTADGFVARLHIPIRTSNAVTFYGWDARGNKLSKNLPQGALCYLDQRKPHAVTNTDAKLDRIHLVVDCFADKRLRALIADARPFSKAA